jgi:hypothetical protein
MMEKSWAWLGDYIVRRSDRGKMPKADFPIQYSLLITRCQLTVSNHLPLRFTTEH